MKLVIFDLDQTLVDMIDIHDNATCCLFKEVFGIEARLSEIDYAGNTLQNNFHTLAKRKNIPEETFKNQSRILLKKYTKYFVESVPAKGLQYLLPGVINLLDFLTANGDVLVLYTGDTREVANAIVRSTGLDKYFRRFYFGDEFRRRSDMIKRAIQEAQKDFGRPLAHDEIIVIGDSLRDIEAAKESNATSISVATGFHSAAQLLQARPDYLFPNFEDFSAVAKAIAG